MWSIFKKYKVQKGAVIVYDTYKNGNYIQNKTVTIPRDAVIVGDKLKKGEVEYISFNAKEWGVDELVQIPVANVKYMFPWVVVISVIVIIVVTVITYKRINK